MKSKSVALFSREDEQRALTLVDPWAPRIHEVVGSILNLDYFTGDPTCSFGPWPPCGIKGQRVWLSIESAGHAPLQVLEGVSIIEEEAREGVTKNLSRSWFEGLQPGSELRVVAKIALCSSDSESNAVRLPVRSYTFKRFLREGREEFNDLFDLRWSYRIHEFGNGLSVKLVSEWSGLSAGVRQLGVGGPDWGESCFYLNLCLVQFSFVNPVSSVGFSVIGLKEEDTGCYVQFKEVGMPWGEYIYMPANGGVDQPAKDVLFESERGIECFDIYHFPDSFDHLYLDNLVWTRSS